MEATYLNTPTAIHLVRPRDAHALCGEPVRYSWELGEKTTSGLSATCSRCRRVAELQEPRF